MKKQEILNEQENDPELSAVISTFSAIYLGNPKQISYSDTYNRVYKLYKKGLSDEILSKLKSVSISHFSSLLAKIHQQNYQIGQYSQMIHQARQAIERLSEILLYLDSNYTNNSKSSHNTIKALLNSIFFDQIYKDKKTLGHIAELISESRCKEANHEIVKLIQAINNLDQKEVFLPEFLAPFYEKRISDNFKSIFQQHYSTLSLTQFFQKARLAFQQQRQWLLKYFLRAKGKKIVDELMKKIFESSFDQLKQKILNEKSQQIFQSAALPFLQLLNQKNQLKQINDFNDWYIEQAKRRLQKIDRTNNTKFLKQFVKQYLFVSGCLSGVKGFNLGYKLTFFFEHWINEEKICLPKRLNIYFEELILKSETGNEDLNNFSILFKFLKQKDYFEKQFRRACALRMIYDPTKSKSETENQMICQMSKQCGSDWIEKLKNLKNALEESETFVEARSSFFNAIVFEDSVWPFPKIKKSSSIPDALLSLTGKFKEKYQQKHKGRTIQWYPFQGYAIMKIKFGSCSQMLKVDTVMATILLNLETLKFKSTIKNVLGVTNLNLEDALDQLEQLQKEKIVKIESNLKAPDPDRLQIELNLDYKPNDEQIDFTYRYLEQQFTERHGHEELKGERKMMVEAFIVKIMKTGKTMEGRSLHQKITPMIEARGFKYNPAFVDNALAGLVDKRYIKELQDGSYSYLAS